MDIVRNSLKETKAYYELNEHFTAYHLFHILYFFKWIKAKYRRAYFKKLLPGCQIY